MDTRICVFSLRRFKHDAVRCAHYEFEDLITHVDDAAIYCAEPGPHHITRQRIVNRLWRHLGPGFNTLNPGLKPLHIQETAVDVLFMYCMRVWDLVYLNSIKNWRERFTRKICWMEEIWPYELEPMSNLVDVLSHFDLVVTSCSGSVEALQRHIHTRCVYIPPGVDAIRFSACPDFPERTVDVFTIGRRSNGMHEILRNLVEKEKILYIYDTVSGHNVLPENHVHHRELVANIAKRSRFFPVKQSKFDLDWETGGLQEIGERFFEGAAAGTVMIGSKPHNPLFDTLFDWDNAVINVPEEPEAVRSILFSDEGLRARISRQNTVNSLLKHDWLYRWKSVLCHMGMQQRPQLAAREATLKHMAESTAARPLWIDAGLTVRKSQTRDAAGPQR